MDITLYVTEESDRSGGRKLPGRSKKFRNARARRKIERHIDKKRLRGHLTEVWDVRTDQQVNVENEPEHNPQNDELRH